MGTNDYVVENLDLHQLAGADQITGDFDVSFRRRRVAARMVAMIAKSGWASKCEL